MTGVGVEAKRVGDERAKEPGQRILDGHAARREEHAVPLVLLRAPAHHLVVLEWSQGCSTVAAASGECTYQQQRPA